MSRGEEERWDGWPVRRVVTPYVAVETVYVSFRASGEERGYTVLSARALAEAELIAALNDYERWRKERRA